MHIEAKDNVNTTLDVRKGQLTFSNGSIFRGYDYNLDIKIGIDGVVIFKKSIIYCGNCKTTRKCYFIEQSQSSFLEFSKCVFKNKALAQNINRSYCMINGYFRMTDCVFEKIDESHQSQMSFDFAVIKFICYKNGLI